MADYVNQQLSIITEKYNYPKWNSTTTLSSYGGKMFLNYRDQPVFAEIYALMVLKMKGYNGFWIDNYRRRLVDSMNLENRLNTISGRHIELIENLNDGKLFRSGVLGFIRLERTVL